MDISKINSNLGDYLTSSTQQKIQDDTFEATLKKAAQDKDQDGLKSACQEFENYFVNQVFSEMRKTVPDSGLLEASAGRGMYEDMLYEEYAKNISSGKGIGIADMLYKQLSKDNTQE